MLTVFGSIIVDSIFSVPGLPRQGETTLATSLFVGPGGKGANQAVAAAKGGGTVAMVGSIGEDAVSEISMKAFADAGVKTAGVQWVEEPTGSAAVLVDAAGHNAIAVAPSANNRTRCSQLTDTIWSESSTLLMQMEVPYPEIESAILEAKERGVRSLLNLAPAGALSRSAFEALDILIANEVELEMLADILDFVQKPHEALARDVEAALGTDLVVTLGSAGALYISKGEILAAQALAIEPVDTTGAGDAFCGVFAASLDLGLSVEEALKRGCIAGSLTCVKTGAQESQPSRAEIEARL